MDRVGCLQCHRLARVRGLCDACYMRCLAKVQREESTWEKLAVEGKCLTPKPASNHHKKNQIANHNKRVMAGRSDLEKFRRAKRNPEQMGKCEHNKRDGECAICEKVQREMIEQ